MRPLGSIITQYHAGLPKQLNGRREAHFQPAVFQGGVKMNDIELYNNIIKISNNKGYYKINADITNIIDRLTNIYKIPLSNILCYVYIKFKEDNIMDKMKVGSHKEIFITNNIKEILKNKLSLESNRHDILEDLTTELIKSDIKYGKMILDNGSK